MPCPSIVQPSLETQSENTAHPPNPPSESNVEYSEYVGIDDECLYIDIGPQNPIHAPQSPVGTKYRDESGHESGSDDESSSDDESDSDEEVEDVDDIVKDREPPQKPDANYDKKDPPMAVGTLYYDIGAFKLALATHATKYEFQYNIEKSDPTRHRVYCSGKNFSYRWRIHASTLNDGVTIKINFYFNTL